MSKSRSNCPFCGSKRIGCHLRKSGRKSGYQAMCLECGVRQSKRYYSSPERSIEAWNARYEVDGSADSVTEPNLTAEQIDARMEAYAEATEHLNMDWADTEEERRQGDIVAEQIRQMAKRWYERVKA